MIYAINKRTKEHRVVYPDANGKHRASMGERLLQADPDGWIPHDRTGECPMPDNCRCDYRNVRGSYQYDVVAGNVSWTYIIAYRPITNSKEEEMSWNGEGLPPVGSECGRIDMRGGIRRVLIVGHDVMLGRAIYRDPDCSDLEYDSGLADHFRPIRSAEDEAVDGIEKAMHEDGAWRDDEVARSIYRAIRDGKIPGIRLDAE